MTLIVDWRETNPKWPKTRQWCFCVTGVMIDHSGKAQTFTVPCYSLYWVGWGQGRERERDAVNTYYYPPPNLREREQGKTLNLPGDQYAPLLWYHS